MVKLPGMAIVGPDKIALALNLTPQRIHQLVKAGMPKEGRAQYDIGQCLMWYVRYLQRSLGKKEGMDEEGEITSIKAERTRLLKAQADAAEHELSRKRGEVISLSDYELIITDLIVQTRAQLLALPARATTRVKGLDDPNLIERVLSEEVREALKHLSKTVPRMPSRPDPDPAAEGEEPPVKRKAKPSRPRRKAATK